MLTQYEIILRLVIASFLGGMIGLEREKHGQPAGLRTHIILAIGAAIAMCISINLAIQFHAEATNGDPERLAAQVISGIGFLGAGAIFRYGSGVKGLTTAASLWTVAIIGLAIGAGYMSIGIVSTILVLFTLIGLDMFEKYYLHGSATRTIVLKGKDRPRFFEDVKSILKQYNISIKSINFSKDNRNNELEVEAIVKLMKDQDISNIIDAINRIEGVDAFKLCS